VAAYAGRSRGTEEGLGVFEIGVKDFFGTVVKLGLRTRRAVLGNYLLINELRAIFRNEAGREKSRLSFLDMLAWVKP
jgi:hypothetical protein